MAKYKTLTCPKCHGVSVEAIEPGRKKLSLGKAAVGGVLLGPVGAIAGGVALGKRGKTTLHCLGCGAVWEQKL